DVGELGQRENALLARAVREDLDREVLEGRRSRDHGIDSHFISARRRAGWETSRCQTTAWNASAWGVTVSWLTVGPTPPASAPLAVWPPARPTTPATGVRVCCAYCRARTRLGLTLRSRSPPPTEKTRTMSRADRRLTSSQSTNTVSHPWSFT